MPTANEISMLNAARTAGITSRTELANFMGQLGHESGGLTRLEESFRYTRGLAQISVNVPSVLREGREAAEAARLEALDGRPQELARLMYGGRMGNDDVGDGYLYRGRGFIQLTGENNYRATGIALNLDLLIDPGLAADRDNASRIALLFWQTNVPQTDRDDVQAATRAINNGETGLADRLDRFDAWHAVLTPEFIVELDAGRVQAGAGVRPLVGRPAMEDAALRRLETGEDVRQLNDNLRALNIRTENNRPIPIGDTFGRETEQGIRRFQEQQGLPVTGRADLDTLQAVTRAVERQQIQQPGGPNIHAPQQPGQDPRNQAPPEQPHRPLQPQAADAPPVGPPRPADLDPRDRNHPDFALHQQALNLVHKQDEKLGRTPDVRSEQLAASLTRLAKENGMSRIDHLVFSVDNGRSIKAGENVIIVQGELNNPAHDRAHTKADVAVNTPVHESFQKLEVSNQRQSQELLVQQQSQQQMQNAPESRGLSMS